MDEMITRLSERTLWGILADLSETMSDYKPDSNDNVFMFWYQLYKDIEKEIDKRLNADY